MRRFAKPREALPKAREVGIATSAGLAAKRKYAIVGMFVFAAVVTPPDVFSQVGLAVPLILLYEISIIMVRLIERDRAKKEAAEKAAEDAENAKTETTAPAKDEPYTPPAP